MPEPRNGYARVSDDVRGPTTMKNALLPFWRHWERLSPAVASRALTRNARAPEQLALTVPGTPGPVGPVPTR